MAEQHASTEASDIPASQLKTDPGTGGDVLVSLMRDAGVNVAFGVISIHNIPLVEAIDRDLRFVPVRHEAAAINAADGFSRATGRIGVAITSTGTGAGNAAGAMLEALTAQSRVLHVTGNIASEHLGEGRGVYHEVPRQLDMLESVSAHALRIDKPKLARRVLTEAIHLLGSAPHGPVSVDWPIDLQYTADPAKQHKPRSTEPEIEEPSRRDIAKAVRVMRRAKRPLVWVGGGAREVGPAITELVEQWGAGVLSSANGRGSVPEEHPLLIGNFASDEAIEQLIEDADCLLTVGSHLRANETKNFELPLPKRHVQIDLNADALARNFPVTIGIQADARSAVPALLEALEKPSTDAEWAGRVRAAAQAARDDHRGEIGAYAQICDSMRARLPRPSPIVRDVTIPGSSWGNRLLPIYSPTTNIFAAGGGIGQGLAMAIGSAIGVPDAPTLALIGDGGLAVHLGELCTLADQQAPVIVALFNDGGYGVLRNMQTAKDSPPRAVDLRTPDFAQLAGSLGLAHRRVTDATAFDQALADAVHRAGPSIIEIDGAALDPQPEPFVPPTEAP
ncbi:thiamine pyrophosphate-binding protein [Blastococcus sp. Marseille-P5729]|uniref:thiamine pyrophosphate-binding protein n=1 Tax=Blastococcus sp. Marseille-P5729 TaxID=2086582 RepID=UPI000D10016D|nr:thiamine pyrophosphate-binding protein [Blastococcus sp. Marseille-P5729]